MVDLCQGMASRIESREPPTTGLNTDRLPVPPTSLKAPSDLEGRGHRGQKSPHGSRMKGDLEL